MECSIPSCRKSFFRLDLLQRHEDEQYGRHQHQSHLDSADKCRSIQSGARDRVSSHQLDPARSNLGLMSSSTTRSGSMMEEPLSDEAHVPQYVEIDTPVTDTPIASHSYAFPAWSPHPTSSTSYGNTNLVAGELVTADPLADAAHLGERSSFLPETSQYGFDQSQHPRSMTYATGWPRRRISGPPTMTAYAPASRSQFLANPTSQYQSSSQSSLEQHYAGNYMYDAMSSVRPANFIDPSMDSDDAALATIETSPTAARQTRGRRSKKQASR